MADERWFTVTEIAELLKIHPETIRRWLRSGELAGANFGGSGWRVRESVLNAFIATRERKEQQP